MKSKWIYILTILAYVLVSFLLLNMGYFTKQPHRIVLENLSDGSLVYGVDFIVNQNKDEYREIYISVNFIMSGDVVFLEELATTSVGIRTESPYYKLRYLKEGWLTPILMYYDKRKSADFMDFYRGDLYGIACERNVRWSIQIPSRADSLWPVANLYIPIKKDPTLRILQNLGERDEVCDDDLAITYECKQMESLKCKFTMNILLRPHSRVEIKGDSYLIETLNSSIKDLSQVHILNLNSAVEP